MRLRKSLVYREKHHLKAGPRFMKTIEIGIRSPTSRIFRNLQETKLSFSQGQKVGPATRVSFYHQSRVARWPNNDN